MTVREFYDSIGGNYDEVMSRLMKETRILTYLKLSLSNSDCSAIVAALDAEDYDAAFRSAHNLKGVCLNLGLGDYTKAVTEVCESVRHGKPDFDLSGMVAEMVGQNAYVTQQIRALVGE